MSGKPYYGGYRQSPRVARRERVIADNNFDNSPKWAPFYARPWQAPPQERQVGAFGIDGLGRLSVSQGPDLGFVPVGGILGVLEHDGPELALDADSSAVGGIMMLGSASGTEIFLPKARAGLYFQFHIDVSVTSNVDKILCAPEDRLEGWYRQSTDGTYTETLHIANGSSHRAWSGNGSTTGGIAGDVIHFVGLPHKNAWKVWGWGTATGSEATPFADS